MEDNVFDWMTQEIERLANERLKNMTKQEITDKAKECKKKRKKSIIRALMICLGIFLVPILFSLLQRTINTDNIVICSCGACAVTAICIIQIILEGKKDPIDVVLKEIKKEIEAELGDKTDVTQGSVIDNSFMVTKIININGQSRLLIDNENKMFIYCKDKKYSKTYSFSEVISYEVYENGVSKVQGRAGSALVGGLFFGAVGAIVGSSMNRSVNEKCNNLKLFIRIKDFDCPNMIISFVDGEDFDKTGSRYKNIVENLQNVCSLLEYMMNDKRVGQEEASKLESKGATVKDNKEQLRELKELLDEGLITQEDFEQKKKQILGL